VCYVASLACEEADRTPVETTIGTDPKALRVVIRLDSLLSGYWVLFDQDPHTGLCTGKRVPLQEVFFFPEYCSEGPANIERLVSYTVGLFLGARGTQRGFLNAAGAVRTRQRTLITDSVSAA